MNHAAVRKQKTLSNSFKHFEFPAFFHVITGLRQTAHFMTDLRVYGPWASDEKPHVLYVIQSVMMLVNDDDEGEKECF